MANVACMTLDVACRTTADGELDMTVIVVLYAV